MKMGIALAALATALASLPCASLGEVQSRVIDYRQGDTTLQGFLAWDDAAKGPRPGVLVVHEWWGENDFARNQAMRFARAGFVAMALDMYGDGKVATHPQDAQAFMKDATKDPAVVRARFESALGVLKSQPQVDATKIAAVGYCFGGNVALSMARAGEPLEAVATFHAAIPDTSTPPSGKVKTKDILINTGAADPMVPPARAEEFAKQMREAGAKVNVIVYPGAKHSFTNPDAAKAGMDALAYDPDADKKSFDAAVKMFHAAFKS